MQPHVNLLAVLVAATFGMVIPAVWYAPKLFGAAWLQLSGIPEAEAKMNASALALAALCSLASAFALASVISFFGSQTFLQGALAGLELWAGFSLTQMLPDYRFAHRPWKLAFINAGQGALTLTLMGGLLAVWK